MEAKTDLDARVAKLETEIESLRELLRRVGIEEGPMLEQQFADHVAGLSKKAALPILL